jgi:hypothetical protein
MDRTSHTHTHTPADDQIKSMAQSPAKANKVFQLMNNFPVVWDPDIHYFVPKNMPLVHVLIQMNSVHTVILFL